jgi:hypothetical protein
MIAPTAKIIILFVFSGEIGVSAGSAIAMLTILESSSALEKRASSSFLA